MPKSSKSPCMDCKERSIGCHDRCEKYQLWKMGKPENPEEIDKDREYYSYLKEINAKRKYYAKPVDKKGGIQDG